MRHGAGPFIQNADSENREGCIDNIDINSGKTRLGCYFCNDVVAPEDVSNQIEKLKIPSQLLSIYFTILSKYLGLVMVKFERRSPLLSMPLV